MKYISSVVNIVFLLFIAHFSFSQSILTPKDTSENLNDHPWKTNNLLSGEYQIEQDAHSNVIWMQIDRTKRDATDQTVSTIIKSATVRRNQGEIVLEARLRRESGLDKGLVGFYVQGFSENGQTLIFNNMQDWHVLETDSFINYRVPLPFDAFLDRVHWGIFATGTAKVAVTNISITIQEGEFTPSWEKKYTQRVRDEERFVTTLANLAKLWGYLKYHHPQAVAQRMDWDQVLIDRIFDMFEEQEDKAYNTIFLSMLDTLGPIPEGDPSVKNRNDHVLINQGDRWLTSAFNDDQITNRLLEIQQNHQPFNNRYITYSELGTPNPQFGNEIGYKQMKLPSVSYRLLALFRYWNAINYFYPYKYATGYDWDSILMDFIPVFVGANTTLEYKRAVLRLNATLNDSHSLYVGGIDHIHELPYLVNNFAGTTDSIVSILPLKISIVDQKFLISQIDSSFAKHSTLSRGDQVLEINGTPVSALKARYSDFIAASNQHNKDVVIENFHLLSWLKIGADSLVHIKYQHETEINTVSIRYHVTQYLSYIGTLLRPDSNLPENSTCFQLLNDSTMYLNPALLDTHRVPEVVSKLHVINSLIIDFRTYPNYAGTKALLTDLLFDREPRVKFQWTDIQYPGILNEPVVETIQKQGKGFSGKLIILINEESKSASELFAMLYGQASSQAILVGRTTAGATGDRSHIGLPGGFTLSFTGIRVNYEDGTEIFRRGIVPDIRVDRNRESILNQSDEILEFVLKTPFLIH